jgi:hypothetical protein
MIRLYWQCPKCNGMNPMSSDLSELSPYEYWWDEYDMTPSLSIRDRCTHCQHLLDNILLIGEE